MSNAFSGNFITIENCLHLGSVDGLKFITESGYIKTAKEFVFSDAGTPYLYWGEYRAGCLYPAINIKIFNKMKWL